MTAAQRLSARRLRWCFAIIMVLFSVFGLRLFQIQGFDAQAYAAKSKLAGKSSTVIPATRGEILDRNGKVLATSVDAMTITADPTLTAEDAPQVAGLLLKYLGKDRIDYFATIKKLRTPKSRFVYIEKQIPAWTAKKAVTAIRKAGFAGLYTQQESLRSYPGGKLAANLVGYVNGEGTGVQGIEAKYDSRLKGTDGSATYEVSPTGQRIPMADSTVKEMKPGENIETTIDRDLQWYADQRLADAVRASSSDWGLAVTMDVKTGQVVQLSQAPTFDADDKTGMDDYNTVSRFVQTVYEPGSVMKTVTMAALADQGKITPSTKIKVPSGLVIDKFPIGDYWKHGVINLTAAGVIAKSSNLGTIVAAQQMSDSMMYSY
ncbi:MAG: penicillin-binding protein 2, partial [Actinomycetales bacterium]